MSIYFISMGEIDTLTAQLAGTKVEDVSESTTLSFAGKSWKLDTVEDAKPITDAIKSFPHLKCLVLEGNTISPEAGKAIGCALEGHPEFQRARWKDTFTGRLAEQIPIALNFLGGGMMLAGAHLVELDLSDNAFGPRGMEGIQELLKSKVCYSLKELRLNNQGLGITGATMLAESLLKCHENSVGAGTPLALEVLICGRNRLENEGAKKMSQFFKTCKTLREIQIPQNGIYYPGITALAEAFSENPNLRILNLRDNTFTDKGAKAIGKVLPLLSNLEIINFGDCLMKSKGAKFIAEGLIKGCPKLKDVTLSYNEMGLRGGNDIVDALASKTLLERVDLNGNQFGEDGVESIRSKLKDGISGSFSDDEGSDEENDNYDAADDSTTHNGHSIHDSSSEALEPVSPGEFLRRPTKGGFLELGEKPLDPLLEALKGSPLNSYIGAFMNIGSLIEGDEEIAESARECASLLLLQTYELYASELVSNELLVHLGLLKGEDKKFKCHWKLHGPLISLALAVNKSSFPRDAVDTLQAFLSLPNESVDKYTSAKHRLMQSIFQY